MGGLSKRLEDSVGTLFAVQGDIPIGRRVIVPGFVEHVESPKTVLVLEPAFRYHQEYRNITHPAPHVFKDVKEPVVPIITFTPVYDQTRIQNLLEGIGFEDCTDQYNFYLKKRRSRISPINHQGIYGFKQEYVARIYLEEGKLKKWEIIWPPEKGSPSRDLNPGSPHYQCGALTRL
jgi:hypothetical protein